MINGNNKNTHYLSLSYNFLISNKEFHYLFFLIEIVFITLQILQIYYNKYESAKSENIKIYFFITQLIRVIKNLKISIQFSIYFIIIILITFFRLLIKFVYLSQNKFFGFIINLNEIFFYRIGSIIIFNFLFCFNDIYLIIGIIISIPYILILINDFSINHLTNFMFEFIKYPYDSFSKIIDIILLFVKIFLSISSMVYNKYLSKFFFILSIVILFFLQLYLTYILVYKSYLLMNNVSLNKIRYAILLSNCIIILLFLINDINQFDNIFYIICYGNIIILCFLLIIIFYDPYQFIKIKTDNNEENIFYYFFILDRDKNKNLILERKIEEHISNCGTCNLCKKYHKIKEHDKYENIDLYNIIYNNKNYALNLMNKLLREIKTRGKESISNNPYFLINLIYLYYIGTIHKDHCFYLNIELIYQIIISENNNQQLDDYNRYLNNIKYTNNFLIKSKEILDSINKILEEKNTNKQYELLFNLRILIDGLKFKEIQNNNNNDGNYNSNMNDKTLNCSNILTICSLFYEELYNESISNSRINIRNSQNILDDLINNNLKTQKLITLEIASKNFQIKIIRAGGDLNKYENYSLFNLFPEIFKIKQISFMKEILLNPNKEQKIETKNESNNQDNNNNQKNEFNYINMNFIIEEKEGDNIYYQILKLDLYFVLLKNINLIFYLNGKYNIEKNIIITKQSKGDECLFHLGNKALINKISEISKENNLKIKKVKINGDKYLLNNKLKEEKNVLKGIKHYKVYTFITKAKKNNFSIYNKQRNNLLNEEEQTNNSENNDKLIYNDAASQSSSVTSSISKNNLMLSNIKKSQVQNGENITKNFKIIKYILWIFIFSLIIILVIEYLILKLYHTNLSQEIHFYLNISKYYLYYSRIFCSILSLSCVGFFPGFPDCANTIQEYYQYQLINYDMSEQSLIWVDFQKLFFNQEQIMYQTLDETKGYIFDFLSKDSDGKFNDYFGSNLEHYKINQNMENNKLNLTLKKEKLTFGDFLLLINSRLFLLSKDFDNLASPIFIINKFFEKDTFENVNEINEMNAYQENYYLLLLDNNEFSTYLADIISKIKKKIYDKINSFRKYLMIVLIINILIYFLIFSFLFGYFSIYLIILFQIFHDINIFLTEKLGEIDIKEIMKKKIDNLKLILNFYDNELNETINELNSLYHKYKENIESKIKEESKFGKKENLNENDKEINNNNIFKLFKFKYFIIFFNYSSRKNIYLSSLLLLIIFVFLIFGIYIIILIIYLNKQNSALNWIDLTKELSDSTNILMSNFLTMIFTNQTFSEISSKLPQKDFTSYMYDKLNNLYEAEGYVNNIQSLFKYPENKINYDCNTFYLNLDYPYFNSLLEKYKLNNETDNFYYTLKYFCETSNVMAFKNYKTVYMQYFNLIDNLMQNFVNGDYYDIFGFIIYEDITRIEILYFVTYTYLLDLMNINIQNIFEDILNEINNKINILGIIFLIAYAHLLLSIYFSFTRNVDKDCKTFIQMKKIFRICNINE